MSRETLGFVDLFILFLKALQFKENTRYIRYIDVMKCNYYPPSKSRSSWQANRELKVAVKITFSFFFVSPPSNHYFPFVGYAQGK